MVTHTHAARDHNLLGTIVDVNVKASTPGQAEDQTNKVLSEMRRLQCIFDTFDLSSELMAHRSGADAGSELQAVIDLAKQWEQRSGGAFNSEIDGVLNLNAIAKGWIVDRGVELASSMSSVSSAWVNAGGDIAHRGQGSVTVGIEDPGRPYDNVQPANTVSIANAALATSGTSRRGHHILDPATGLPAHDLPSLSVIAPDTATADVLATIGVVMGPARGLDFIDSQPECAALAILCDGTQVKSRRWPSRASPSRGSPTRSR